MKYTMDNYEDLYDSFLEENDKVIFTVNGKNLIYTVMDNHLSEPGTTNSTIFKVLDLDKYKYCSEKYRYNTESGNWPCYKYKDFNAATNLVLALFELCDKKQFQETKKECKEQSKCYTLKKNDVIYFQVHGVKKLKYIVRESFLENDDEDNQELFNLLSLSYEQKMQWALWGYKKQPHEGDWPEYPKEDYSSITNWVNEIQQILKIIRDTCAKKDAYWKIICDFYEIKTPEQSINKTSSSINIKSENDNGKIIKTQRITPSVVRGEKRRGHTVQGKNSRTSVTGGHLGYRTIIG